MGAAVLIVCNGMPRAGSTLVYNLVRTYCEHTGGVRSMGFFGEEELRRNLPDLEAAAVSDEVWILKTHYDFDPGLLNNSSRVLAIYTIRDPRKVAVSMMRIWQFSEAKVIEDLRTHMAISEAHTNRPEVFFVRYEDLDKVREELFSKIGRFLGRDVSVEAMEAAIRFADDIRNKSGSDSFGNSKAFIARSVLAVNRRVRAGRLLKRVFSDRFVAALKDRVLFVDKETMLHPGHVGPTSLQTDVTGLTRKIEAEFGDWMVEHGYAVDTPTQET